MLVGIHGYSNNVDIKNTNFSTISDTMIHDTERLIEEEEEEEEER